MRKGLNSNVFCMISITYHSSSNTTLAGDEHSFVFFFYFGMAGVLSDPAWSHCVGKVNIRVRFPVPPAIAFLSPAC